MPLSPFCERPHGVRRNFLDKAGVMSLDMFFQHFFNALTLGSLYGLIAIGYTMMYGQIIAAQGGFFAENGSWQASGTVFA